MLTQETQINESLIQTNTQTQFSDFDLPEFLVQSLERNGIKHPSPVQEKSLPLLLQGQDILASAQTGTGKTIAFLLPIITKMLENPESNALILAPTRELAVQVKEAAFKLLPKDGPKIRSISLIGGEPIMKQISQLKGLEEGAVTQRRPQQTRGSFRRGPMPMPTGGNGIHKNVIFVGTPGRIKDLLERKAINLEKANFVVLDETDRMLDLGFKDELDEIFTYLPQERQTLMFSATMPSKIVSLSRQYLKNPARVDIEKKLENQPKIKQEIVKYSYSHKFKELVKILNEREGSAIIFVKTKMGCEELSAKLEAEGFESRAIHGDLKQRERDFVIKSMKIGKIRIMVATDVAARGLHIQNLSCVINYDLPGTKEDYTHRIGRTGRAGAEGLAISFVNEDDFREAKVVKAYMKSEDDEDNEDVKSFSRDYTSRRKPSGFGGNRRSGGGFRERSNFGGRDERPERRRNFEERHSFEGKREEGKKRGFFNKFRGN